MRQSGCQHLEEGLVEMHAADVAGAAQGVGAQGQQPGFGGGFDRGRAHTRRGREHRHFTEALARAQHMQQAPALLHARLAIDDEADRIAALIFFHDQRASLHPAEL